MFPWQKRRAISIEDGVAMAEREAMVESMSSGIHHVAAFATGLVPNEMKKAMPEHWTAFLLVQLEGKTIVFAWAYFDMVDGCPIGRPGTKAESSIAVVMFTDEGHIVRRDDGGYPCCQLQHSPSILRDIKVNQMLMTELLGAMRISVNKCVRAGEV